MGRPSSTALTNILGASILLINSSPSSRRLSTSSSVGPVGLDTETDGIMANLVWSKELLTREHFLPSLRDQQKQIGPIDRHLAIEHCKPELTPHDV